MKKAFLDINFICDLLISRKTSLASRKELENLIENDVETLLHTSSLPTIYYIVSNMHKENVYYIHQMKLLKNEVLGLKEKLNSKNALDIANFFINEIQKTPDSNNFKIKAIKILNDLCNNVIQLVPTTINATNLALKHCKDNPKDDFEDILQYFCALENKCDVIYTNDKTFPKLDIILKRTDKNISDYLPN